MTPAELRRVLARHGDAALTADAFDVAAVCAPLTPDVVASLLAEVALDPAQPFLREDRAEVRAWIDASPLAIRVAPGAGAVIDEAAAAVLAAPSVLGATGLTAAALGRRAAQGADDVFGAALARLAPELAIAAIGKLAAEPLTDEPTLHLALRQAGRCAAWCSGTLGDRAELAALVDKLLGLLVPATPSSVIDGVIAALGPIAATATATGARVRDRALALVEEHMRVVEPAVAASSFLGEFDRLRRGQQDEEYFRLLPRRRLAERAAELVGRGAHRGELAALRARVVDAWESPGDLLPAFALGVTASADLATAEALARHLLRARDGEPELALQIASELPLDALASEWLTMLASDDVGAQQAAIPAVALLPAEQAVPALAALLDGDDPDVCALAANALREHGQLELLARHRLPDRSQSERRLGVAAIRAVIPDHGHAVLTELVAAVGGELSAADELFDAGDEAAAEEAAMLLDELSTAPLVAVLGESLRASVTGIERTAQLLREIPDSLPVLGLALPVGHGIALPAALRDPLAAALQTIIDEDPGTTEMALQLLAQFSLGDRPLHDRLIALAGPDALPPELIGALSQIGIRSATLADRLATMIDQLTDLEQRMVGVSAAGALAPDDHPVWAKVRASLGLGQMLGDVAAEALETRARRAGATS